MNEVKLGGGDYFGEKSSPTNAFSSSVESSVLYRDKNVYPEIEKLKTEKENNIIMKELITTVLELLEKEERKLIELRYFSKPKKSWDAISMEMCISKVACHSMRKEVVSKLSTYIV